MVRFRSNCHRNHIARQTSSDPATTNFLEPLRRAIKAAEVAGFSARVMCQIGRAPGNLADLLDLLRPGDVLTHAFSGARNNVVQNGKLLPAAAAAKQRGVVIDVGHGGGVLTSPLPTRPCNRASCCRREHPRNRREGLVEMVDTVKNTRRGSKRLVPVLTVRAGRPFGRPPLPLSFTY